jgi:hypothetical protein
MVVKRGVARADRVYILLANNNLRPESRLAQWYFFLLC